MYTLIVSCLLSLLSDLHEFPDLQDSLALSLHCSQPYTSMHLGKDVNIEMLSWSSNLINEIYVLRFQDILLY